MEPKELKELQYIARKVRCNIVRMLGEAGSGHPGGSLSAVEIITALYYKEMKIDPQRPDWPLRDRFVLSKGHAAPVLYAVLAEKGYFPEEELMKLRKLGSRLQGHPDMNKLPGIDMSTGSLGQGLSAAMGMAIAAKLDKTNARIYALIGDGESQEGIVWEAAMAAAYYKLDNLTVILDHNRLQIDGAITEVMSPEPFADKWIAFGWDVLTVDGHDFEQLLAAYDKAKQQKDKPLIIIADTVKGKGVSFMENQVSWHGKAPKAEEITLALRELGGIK